MLKSSLIVPALIILILCASADIFAQKNRGSRKNNNARVAKPAGNPTENAKKCLGRENSIECVRSDGNNQRTTSPGGSQPANQQNTQSNILPYVEQQNLKNRENTGNSNNSSTDSRMANPNQNPSNLNQPPSNQKPFYGGHEEGTGIRTKENAEQNQGSQSQTTPPRDRSFLGTAHEGSGIKTKENNQAGVPIRNQITPRDRSFIGTSHEGTGIKTRKNSSNLPKPNKRPKNRPKDRN